MHTRHWWWLSIAFITDCTLQNAWLLYRQSPANTHCPMDLLGFKRQVALVYTKVLTANCNLNKVSVGCPAPMQSGYHRT